MTPSHTTRKGTRRYRYYVCTSAQKRGWDTCPTQSIPAGPVEKFVVDQIRCIGRDPDLIKEVLAQTEKLHQARIIELTAEERVLAKDIMAWHDEVRIVSIQPGDEQGKRLGRLADLHERIGQAERRLREIRSQIDTIAGERVSVDEATRALSAFDPVWGTLTPREQTRMIQLLVEQVEYDGSNGRVTVAFRPTGIKTLSEEAV